MPTFLYASTSCRAGGSPPLKIVSPSRQTNGSPGPTCRFAWYTASPSPRCSGCRTEWTFTLATSSSIDASNACFPPAASRASSSGLRSKWSSIARFSREVTSRTSSMPAAEASSTTYWTVGRSRIGSSSFGTALAAGSMRVPKPATGMTALRITGLSTK